MCFVLLYIRIPWLAHTTILSYPTKDGPSGCNRLEDNNTQLIFTASVFLVGTLPPILVVKYKSAV